jgi:quinol monooxygenase YgiN
MSQVVVVATFTLRPDKQEEANAAFASLAEQTHGEAGCLTYALHVDPQDPLTLVGIECWDSQPALDNHFQQPYVTELLARAGDFLAAPPEIRILAPVPHGDPAKGTLQPA